MEDGAAELFLRQLLERKMAHLSRRIEIQDRQGDGNIIALLGKIGSQFGKVKVIGVFDADRREHVPEELTSMAIVLPGDVAIEKIFRTLLEENPAEFEKVSRSRDVAVILASLQGRDHHDWQRGLCEQLGLNSAQLFSLLFRIWEERPGNKEAMDQLVADLVKLI